MSREDENYLFVKSQYNGICATCMKYSHKSKDCSHREGVNVPKIITVTNLDMSINTFGIRR